MYNSKLLDSSMSPLGFDAQQMFRFLAVRFRGTHLRVQQQTLNWLQLLSSLHIVVPIDLLVNIFQEGVNTSKLDDNDMMNLGLSHQFLNYHLSKFLLVTFQIRRKNGHCLPYPIRVFRRPIYL